MANLANVEEFDREWVNLAEEVIHRIFASSEIQELKNKFRENGHLSVTERSKFITLVDTIKYEVIFGKYGPAGSDGFRAFTANWENWLKLKGIVRDKPVNLFEENINHLLFGSTPDPEQFLREYQLYEDGEKQ